MRRSFRVLAIATFLAGGLGAAGCMQSSGVAPSENGGTITIGTDLPLSGADASDGVPTANAVKLAIRDANNGKLVPGFTLTLDLRDDTVNGVHDPDKGVTNFKEFVANPNALGVIGPLNSNV